MYMNLNLNHYSKLPSNGLPVCGNETNIPHVTYDNFYVGTGEFLIRANCNSK